MTIFNSLITFLQVVDLLVMMNSFLPKGGHILFVCVYPSKFGLKQMEEEVVRGPALFGSDDESDEDDESELDNEKLRQYEKARLRYKLVNVFECCFC
ncbi:hypothetical protein SUGI_0800420 [Cryptomeria japonica]|nr:hypothetical protein SUGI_0800420 [Cryptomeria japonica]